nr:hypothetical protein [Klebsiella michiganensis]
MFLIVQKKNRFGGACLPVPLRLLPSGYQIARKTSPNADGDISAVIA